MNAPLDNNQFEILRRLDTCTMANAIETFNQRLRNEGFTDSSIHCQFPQMPPMLGYAATVKVRGSLPPMGNKVYPYHTDWLDYIASLPSPRVLVVQDAATIIGSGSFVDLVHIHILNALHCVGAVTNGSVRGVSAAEALGFQLFAGSLSVSHTYLHIVEFGTPVQVAGLKVQSGELIHGDRHGVQSIPADIAPKIPRVAAEVLAREQDLVTLCHSKDFSLEKLKAALAQGKH